MNKVLISVLGQDQPGILSAMAHVLDEHDGNIENLSQTLLQSVFGALLLASVPESETPSALQDALEAGTRDFGLFIRVHAYRGGTAHSEDLDVEPYIVSAMGPDRQGLVAELADRLGQHDVNITNVQAVFKGGSEDFDNLMIFEVDVPCHTDMTTLRGNLAEVAQRLSLEITLQHRKIFESVSRLQQ